jgi:hypothetical protein
MRTGTLLAAAALLSALPGAVDAGLVPSGAAAGGTDGSPFPIHAAAVIAAAPAPDSVLLGRVVEAGSNRPIPAATVLLLDAEGNRRAGGFTRADGTFSLSVVPAQGNVLRVERLGYLTLDQPVGMDTPRAPGVVELRMEPRPFEFTSFEVTAESRCAMDPSVAGQTYDLWEATRVALQAAELTESEALARHRTRTWQYRENQDATAVEGRTWSDQVTVGRPFETLPPAALARQGYVQETDGVERIVHGPDARVLLSDDFAGSHCFRVEAPAPAPDDTLDETWIGLAFEPSPEPASVVRIGGTLWLDQASGELRRLEFRYLWYQPRAGAWVPWGADSGGTIQFRALDDGRWVVDAWSLRVLSGVGRAGVWYDVAGGRLLQVLEGADGP